MSRRKRSKSSRGAEGPAPSHNASRQGIKFLFGGAGLVLLVVAAYWPALHAGFVWDDDFMLTNNPVVKSAHGLRYIWFSTALPDYFPLTSTSLWAEWQIWGMKAWAYHLTNVLLHALSTIVLWRIFRMMRWSGAWIMAAIFAVHPVNVESVAWIAERKNVLAMFFYALTWYALLRSLNGEYGRSKEGNNQNSKVHNTDVLHASWYWLSVIFFLLALLSKTAVVMFPFALLLFFWWKNRKLTWPDVLRSLPFFALSLTLGLVMMWFQSHRAIAGDFSETTGIWTKAARAAWAFWFYVYKAVAPFHLSFVYPEWNGTSVFVWVAAVATVILFALLYR